MGVDCNRDSVVLATLVKPRLIRHRQERREGPDLRLAARLTVSLP